MDRPTSKIPSEIFSAILDLLLRGFSENPDAIYYFLLQGINEKEAAKFIGYSVRTLQSFRVKGGGPVYFHPTKKSVRYRRLECLLWFENGMVKSTSQYDGIITQFSDHMKMSPPPADNDNSDLT